MSDLSSWQSPRRRIGALLLGSFPQLYSIGPKSPLGTSESSSPGLYLRPHQARGRGRVVAIYTCLARYEVLDARNGQVEPESLCNGASKIPVLCAVEGILQWLEQGWSIWFRSEGWRMMTRRDAFA